ncbi:ATP-dependent nuclease [Maribacter sp. 4G9]|uniref:ATP-dependent nuclease n=1 Tax=Maribacter sp. 4G9 TaxID=1889777 RepID=UPI000C15B69A|nr:AAA family ATPase [Maribacter sp. 4G9]PIB38434.1 hypothetical protein BFP75_16135 [Maribacter sp. 4G9]
MIESLKLQSGLSIDLKPTNLFIGPNNSGKSTLLLEIQNLITTESLLKSYTPNSLKLSEVRDFIEKRGKKIPAPSGGSWNYKTWDESKSLIESNFDFISKRLHRNKWIDSTTILDGKARLSIIEDMNYQGVAPKNPLNVFEVLRHDDSLRSKLQSYLQKVMPEKYFALWNPNLNKLCAYLCDSEPKNDIEYYDSIKAHDFFEKDAAPLLSYSDGIKAYIGILINLIASGKRYFLIDEPEAFLHPNLCFQLGKTVSQIARENNYLCFCATHSPFFLKGCLSQSPNNVTVTRLGYESGVGKAKTIKPKDIKAIIHDPLLNNIGVIEGLFHSRVVMTEGDSDRAFYTEINNRMLAETEDGIRDCIFINAQNKQTIAKVVSLFRNIEIPCAAISDIDTFKEGGTNFTNILKALSIKGGTAEALSILRSRTNENLKVAARGESTDERSFETIEKRLTEFKNKGKSPSLFLAALQKLNRPPDYKRLGGVTLLEGQDFDDALNLIGQLANNG